MRDRDDPTTAKEADRAHHPPAGRVTAPRGRSAPDGLLGLQASIGNAAVVQLLRQAGHAGAREQHDPGPGRDETEHPEVQRSAVHDVLRARGRTLDATTRADMEARLGADFSDVRVHDDTAARASATELGARAYTSGSHVVLGEGGADPQILAHELTHVIQQRTGPVAGTDRGDGLRVSDPSDRFEREAEANAHRAMADPVSTDRPPVSTPQAEAHTSNQLQRATTNPDTRADLMDVDEVSEENRGAQDVEMSGTTHETGSDEYFNSSDDEDLLKAEELARIGPMTRPERHKEFLRALKREFLNSKKWAVDPQDDEFSALTTDEKKSQPRSYKDTPEIEGLRWISTVTKTYLSTTQKTANSTFNPVEVQAAIGKDGRLILAANDGDSNGHLDWLINHDKVGDLLGYMLKGARRPKKREGMKADEEDRVDRVNKHFDGATEINTSPSERHQGIASALSKGIAVAKEGPSGLHAERRIAAHEGKTPDYLAGTKRPCATCFAELYPDKTADELDAPNAVRPGRFISRENANANIPEYRDTVDETPQERAKKMFKRIDGAVPRTYMTLTKSGEPARDIGSDSE